MSDTEKSADKKEINAADFLSYNKRHSKITQHIIQGSINIKSAYSPKAKTMHIINCDFQDEFIVSANPNINSIIFQGCSFRKRLIIQNCTLDIVKFHKATFYQHFAFKDLTTRILEIEGCHIQSPRELRLHEFKSEKFTFKNNQCLNDIHLKPLSAGIIWLEGNENKYRVTVVGPSDEQVLKDVRLFSHSGSRTDFEFISFKTQSLHIIGELKDSLLFVKNVTLQTGIIDHFFNEGNFKVFNLQPLNGQSRLVIKNSAFGKTHLINSNFSKFHNVILQDSSLVEVIPVNVKLCTEANLSAASLFANKENFRQLKIISQKHEDLDSKLTYARLEMNTMLKISRSSKGKLADRFVLYTSWLSNDFGNHWGRALLWLLSTSILWYTLIKAMLGYTYLDFSMFLDEIGRFLIFINPIHQFDKLFNVDPNLHNTNGAILIDSLARILNSYLLYQFVNAFRKFAKN